MVPYIINREINEVDIEEAYDSCMVVCFYPDRSLRIWPHGWGGESIPVPLADEVEVDILYLLGNCFYDYVSTIKEIKRKRKTF